MRVLYRIASVLLLLFAIGHTLGFTKTDPKWGSKPLLAQCAQFISTHKASAGVTGIFLSVSGYLSLCSSCSQRHSRGNSVVFDERIWRPCAALRGYSLVALSRWRS